MTVSFKILSQDSLEKVKSFVKDQLPNAQAEDIDAIFDEIAENLDDGCEYAVSSAFGCLLLRIFDGEYIFPYPIALEDGASESLAVNELRRYAIKEEIPLVICDLPKEALGEILPMFRHLSVDAADPFGDYYTLRPTSELALADEIAEESSGSVSLTMLDDEDESDYARLCRDKETARYWGYDFRADMPDPEDAYFLRNAEEELERGVAVSLAIRVDDRLVGEAILYAFDLQGGAQCAVRILAEHRRRGYAKDALLLLERVALRLGLVRLYATVDPENTASLALFDMMFDESASDGKNRIFIRKL